jgi:hypothetical protein
MSSRSANSLVNQVTTESALTCDRYTVDRRRLITTVHFGHRLGFERRGLSGSGEAKRSLP